MDEPIKVKMSCTCEQCKCQHDGTYGSGRFCSQKCARTYATSHITKEQYKQIHQKLHSDYIASHPNRKYNCIVCGRELNWRNKSGYCSKCYHQNITITDSTKQKLSIAMKGRSRWNIKRNQLSFAESYWMNALDINHIPYQREYQIAYDSKHHSYYMDFKIGMIDLEIDGMQHAERIIEDAKRDDFMRSQGYFVYRVKWNDIRSKDGLQMAREKLWLFLDFYERFSDELI